MAEYQTTATSTNMVRGNGKVEVANYVSGDPVWFDVGAVTDLTVEEELSIATEEYDNAVGIDRAYKQEVKLSFTQLEILNLDVWEILRGGLDTITQDSDEIKIKSGDKNTIPFFMCRVTTKNDDKPLYFTAYKCNVQKGFSFQYQKDDAENRVLQNPIEMIAKQDPYRGYYVWELESNYFNG